MAVSFRLSTLCFLFVLIAFALSAKIPSKEELDHSSSKEDSSSSKEDSSSSKEDSSSSKEDSSSGELQSEEKTTRGDDLTTPAPPQPTATAVNVTPEGSPVITVTPEGSPVITVTPEGSPVITVTPEGSPVITVTSEGSPVITVKPAPKPFDCQSKSNGNYVNPADCTTYIACSNGYTHIMSCFAGLVYNENGWCDYVYNVPRCM